MKKSLIIQFILVFWVTVFNLHAQDAPSKSEPSKENQVLQQLVGEWDYESEIHMVPGEPPMKAKGTESARAIGEHWVLIETKGTVFEMPFTGIMTLGYNAEKQKIVGTWIDSMSDFMYIYEGALDESGKVLTLHSEGPNPSEEGKWSKFKDVYEIKSEDQKILTSSMQDDDGKWIKFMTVNYQRKK